MNTTRLFPACSYRASISKAESRMKSMRRYFLAACVFGGLLSVVTAAAQAKLSKAEAELVATDSARYKAMTDRDVPTLEKMLADELVYIHSSSTRQSKSQHLDDLKAGRANYNKIDVKEQVPSIYGNVGIIQGVAEFTTGAREAKFMLRYTSVYVKRDGRLQMVAFSCSRIPEAGTLPP
jgi:hypothetical protein